MARRRILVVDDQQLIILGLERSLRRLRGEWDVETAAGGREALERLRAEAFDALVTDLNMPGLGGGELLDWTRRNRPGVVRIVLSGHQDRGMIQNAASLAHRFLAKPSEPDLLVGTLRQVGAVANLPGELRNAVVGMCSLPCGPIAGHKVRAWRNDPEAPHELFQAGVQEDPGLAAKALQLVHSAFFGRPRPLLSPGAAALLLDRERAAALDIEPEPPPVEARLRPIREAHLHMARAAAAIARAEGAPAAVEDLAYTAALLAAAGAMILEVCGAGPADPSRVAWHYLNLIGIPAPVLEIVARHRAPSEGEGAPSLALAAVHAAAGGDDSSFLARAGYPDRLHAWNQVIETAQGAS